MSDIYAQHDAAFASVSAFVILQGGTRVATVAIKYPRDGAGRLYAYVHRLGVAMVRGHANGYGYDKRSAAVADAARKIEWPIDTGSGSDAFAAAIAKDGGEDWARALRLAQIETKGPDRVRDMESGAREISGPVSVAVEAFLTGFRPSGWRDE